MDAKKFSKVLTSYALRSSSRRELMEYPEKVLSIMGFDKNEADEIMKELNSIPWTNIEDLPDKDVQLGGCWIPIGGDRQSQEMR
ncbi:MAG: hypothetical protein U9N08_00305 [Candidatus Caldatribacteriota bacterium]|nr:hypothetical protein [Candidatus Caldatribacteriota bacterium]